MPITTDTLRRYAVARTLFAPTTLARAIAKLGFVQAAEVRHLFWVIPVFSPQSANEFKDLPRFSGRKQKAYVVARFIV